MVLISYIPLSTSCKNIYGIKRKCQKICAPQVIQLQFESFKTESESESHSVLSDSLQPHGLYSPRNSPGQNTGVGSLSLLQGIFTTQESNPGLLHCRWILYQLRSDLYFFYPSVQFSHSVVSDSLRPHGLQQGRPHCPSQTPGACSNSWPLSQ